MGRITAYALLLFSIVFTFSLQANSNVSFSNNSTSTHSVSSVVSSPNNVSKPTLADKKYSASMSMYEMGADTSESISPSKNPELNMTPPDIEDDVENFVLPESEQSILNNGFGDNFTTGDIDNKTINIVYQDWVETVLATNIAKVIFEDMGYKVVLVKGAPDAIFEDVSGSYAELSLGAWSTMDEEFEQVRGEIERMNNPWFVGAQSGLAVPDYVNLSEIEDLKNTSIFNGGIHVSSLDNRAASGAIKALSKYNMSYRVFSDGSETRMISEVEKAVTNKEPILIATWSPSPVLAKYKMKFLEDTEGTFDDAISIYKIAKLDFYKNYPDAYDVISDFNLTKEETSSMLLQELSGVPVEVVAKQWVENNKAKIESWKKSGQEAVLNQ